MIDLTSTARSVRSFYARLTCLAGQMGDELAPAFESVGTLLPFFDAVSE